MRNPPPRKRKENGFYKPFCLLMFLVMRHLTPRKLVVIAVKKFRVHDKEERLVITGRPVSVNCKQRTANHQNKGNGLQILKAKRPEVCGGKSGNTQARQS